MMKEAILFCATDIGGARNLTPVITEAVNAGLRCIALASKSTQDIFAAEGVEADIATVSSLKDALQYLNYLKPQALITATTKYASTDRFLIAAARIKNIRSLAVLDEWYNYRIRFEDENRELRYLPDVICCQDEMAMQEAKAEGLPKEQLAVTGSPYLWSLSKKKELLVKEFAEPPDFIRGKPRPVLTFLSETHAADYGTKQGGSGPLGKFIGYSEYTVRGDIYHILTTMKVDCTVIEKIHPSSEGSYEMLGGSESVIWVMVKEPSLWHILLHSDIVIGMRSLALLEAVMLGCTAVSYQPSLFTEQLCTAVKLGLIEAVYDKESLYCWIRDAISAGCIKNRNKKIRPAFAYGDVPKRIIGLALAEPAVSRKAGTISL